MDKQKIHERNKKVINYLEWAVRKITMDKFNNSLPSLTEFKIGQWVQLKTDKGNILGEIYTILGHYLISNQEYLSVEPINKTSNIGYLSDAPKSCFVCFSPSLTSNQMFKVGDKVKLTEKFISETKDVIGDFIGQIGEVVKYDKIYNYYKVKIGSHQGFWFSESEIELVESKNFGQSGHPCNCDRDVVVNFGCKCGGY